MYYENSNKPTDQSLTSTTKIKSNFSMFPLVITGHNLLFFSYFQRRVVQNSPYSPYVHVKQGWLSTIMNKNKKLVSKSKQNR